MLDDQLKEYFQQHKKDVKDELFTEAVMRKLPQKEKHYYIVYLFLFIGILLFVLLNGHQQIMTKMVDVTPAITQLKMPLTESVFLLMGILLAIFSISIIGVDKEDSMLSI